MECKICSSGTMIRPEGKNYSTCDVCGASVIHYVPQPHQREFHEDKHVFKAIFGAYGSGKTTTGVIELIRHILSVPDGLSAMLAPTMQMLKETSYSEFMKYMPNTMIVKEFKTKGNEHIIFKNGHKLLLLPSNNADKIRSLNLTAFYLEEASNAKYEVYTELTARTRNKKAIFYEFTPEGKPIRDEKGRQVVKKNKLLGIICSNPDVGWIRTEILHLSNKIYSPKSDGTVYAIDPNANPFLSTHLHSSYQNKYLDPDFQTRIGRGKPDWWVKRYIYGSFEYSEGLVYPMFSDNIVDPFPIPPTWKRMFGVDFGLRDPTVMLGAAIDPDDGVVYIYDEHYKAEEPVSYHAKKMLEMVNKVPHGMINGQIVADPKGQNRSGRDLRSYFNHYSEYGLWFKGGINAIDSGVMKVYTYLALGKLKIMSNCINTIKEGREYKYKETNLTNEKNRGEKPHDANNHAMDSLRYIINELPDDPENVVTDVYSKPSTGPTYNPNKFFPKALQEDDIELEDWYTNF